MYDSPIEKDKKPMYESTTDKINAQDNLINTDSFLSGNKKNESIKSVDNIILMLSIITLLPS